jgi:hypothetical protein
VLTASNLSASLDRHQRTIPLDILDINARFAANRERGIDLRVPADRDEISLSFLKSSRPNNGRQHLRPVLLHGWLILLNGNRTSSGSMIGSLPSLNRTITKHGTESGVGWWCGSDVSIYKVELRGNLGVLRFSAVK